MQSIFYNSISSNPEKIYIHHQDSSLSFIRLAKAVQSYRNFFFKNLVHPNHCLVSISDNPIVNITLLWTCLQLEISFFPINPKFPIKKISSILQAIQPNFVCYPTYISSDSLCQNLNSCLFFSSQIFVEILKNSKEISLKQFEKEPPLKSFDFSTLLLSSGTSGSPKIVSHTLFAHLKSAQGVNQALDFSSQDSWLLSLPIHHVSGLSIAFRALVAGASITTDPLLASHVSFVPSQLNDFLKNPTPHPHLKAILLGGSPVSSSLLHLAAQKSLPLFYSYGSTETASSAYIEKISLSPSNDLIRTHVSTPHRKIKIQSKTKLIQVGGEILASGYRTLDNSRFFPLADSLGWFTTPDIGELKNQILTVLGRNDLIFICGGENVSPLVVETLLLSIHGILLALVTEKADPTFGLVPIAFLSLDPKISLPTVISSAKMILANYEIPKFWFQWPTQWSSLLKPCRTTAKRLVQENLAIPL